jgi:hypothetical protein
MIFLKEHNLLSESEEENDGEEKSDRGGNDFCLEKVFRKIRISEYLMKEKFVN